LPTSDPIPLPPTRTPFPENPLQPIPTSRKIPVLYSIPKNLSKRSTENTKGESNMAVELLAKPQFEVLNKYSLPKSDQGIYTKLNNHHGDQFGKCKIGAKQLKVGKIRILSLEGHQELTGKITLAIWGSDATIKIKNAREGKTTLKGIAMLLVETEELPPYIQAQIT
jgi:hypothetical protein